jgi:hypothetical protein
MQGNAYDVTFPSTLHSDNYPYNRLLAWRLREAAYKNKDNLSVEELNTIVTASELSEAGELSTETSEVEGSSEVSRNAKRARAKP